MADHSASLIGIANQLGDSPFGAVHRRLAPTFSIVVLWVIGRHEKRNKAAESTNKKRHDDRLTHWASRRMAMISPKVQVCQAMKGKIKSAIERSSQQVAEWFRDAVLDCPKLQNLKMLKAKAKRRWN
uniref:Uncharacterized protein n=1 Tax=Solanum tuberosum TaxID=4113 RepID=M1DUG6_SOLTU